MTRKSRPSSKLQSEIKKLKTEIEKYRKKDKHARIINNILETIHKSLDLQKVLNSAVLSMNKHIDNADNVSIYMVEGKEAVLKAHKGYDKNFIKKVSRIPYPKGFTWKAINSGKQVYCADVDKDNFIVPPGRRIGTKSYASKPIRFKGKTIGTLNINSLKKDAFDKEDLKLLDVVSKQIEVAISNAKQADDLIKEKEQAQKILDTAEVMIVVIDDSENVKFINKKGCDLLASKEEEIIGKNWFRNFLPEKTREEVRGVYKKIISGEIHHVEFYENTVLTKNKKERLISWHNSPIKDDKGNIIGTISSGIDITEQRIAEEKFSLLIESSPNGILMTDHRGRINLVNEQIEDQFGYKREELIGKPVELLIPKNIRRKHRKYRSEFMLSPQNRKMGAGRNLYGLHKDGKEFPVEVGLSTIRIGDNISVLATVVDITQRKLTEEAIIESEKMLKGIIDNSPDATLVYDDEGILITYNREAEKFFGENKKDNIKKRVWDIIPPEHEINFSKELKNVKDGKTLTDFEMEKILKNGKRLSVSTNLFYIPGKKGMYVETIRDITERVNLRNRILEFEKAQIVSKMAEGIAHHMGTPLASMLLRIQMLKEDISDFKNSENLAMKLNSIEKQIFYGQKVMQNLLKFSNKPENEKAPVNLSLLLKEALEIVKPLCTKAGINIKLDLDTDIRVLGNSSMLGLVFSDMVMNAIDAMPEGGRLSFKVDLNVNDRDFARIVISDTGAGIPKNVLHSVFEPFFSTKPSGKGTGLGLAVAKRIIHEHRGSISIDSTEGEGTDVKIELPVFKEVH